MGLGPSPRRKAGFGWVRRRWRTRKFGLMGQRLGRLERHPTPRVIGDRCIEPKRGALEAGPARHVVDLWITFYEIAIASNRQMPYNSGGWHAPLETHSTSPLEPPSPPGVAFAAPTLSSRPFLRRQSNSQSLPFRRASGERPSNPHLRPPSPPVAQRRPNRSASAALAAGAATRRRRR
jgi:hypothetical protein